MISKILIANRGEIACRIIATARKLAIATATVYSDADRAGRHVALADEAFRIGPAPARESYLDGAKILEAARRTRADAIHPGYGFLAENADFAEACTAAGFTFIGPPAAAIRAMGDKAAAKALMAGAGVPIVPGFFGEDQDPLGLAEEASRIGYPVLIKPSAGGGGKGMKIVGRAEDFPATLESARREAEAAFGDDRVILEKLLAEPRHVEVQVFADAHGEVVHLFDRDCSIQRRHQKIVEEAPAPDVPEETRRAMREAAILAARKIGYRGAGTVEFLFTPKDEAFYFLEMNTRLQVEHPVTEMITGLDLVEWQIRVAAGAPLPRTQAEIVARGHAIEARISAEDPACAFLPQAGLLRHLDLPAECPFVRIDTGVAAGDVVSTHYDPMIAKLIAHGEDRPEAIRRLHHALGETRILGVATNVAFLGKVVGHEAFAAAALHTGFVEAHEAALFGAAPKAETEALALAVIGLLCARKAEAEAQASASADPWSPWKPTDGFRLNEAATHQIRLHDISAAPGVRMVEVTWQGDGWRLAFPDETVYRHASGRLGADGTLRAELDGHVVSAVWLGSDREIDVFLEGEIARFALLEPAARAEPERGHEGRLTSPMPGRIVAFLVAPGAKVTANEPVLVLEAMKMEHMLRAPSAGIVKEFPFALGAQVEEGALLVTFEPEAP